MSGFRLRPGGRRAQYSAHRKRQWCAAFTVASSARKAARFEKRLFFGGRPAVQHPIAMREAPEPADDVGVTFGVFQVFRIAGFSEKVNEPKLVGQVLRMHEGQIQE